ncbi:MAG: hypothetical protein UX01_C0018G0008 [Candidatus Collierbacteria bacterium GW2011_GWB2_45_17]|uniref:Uncharacterized protein n=1 Tax=Candidatus Collierbacteria bacterium GW2011_GWB2_45_17 TaxID=1618388 RepID=A0A837IJJ6_9BACT|nr:MAG: hypothetical protein UX01_C0018G0008 [Candidatus Collierbacteria bacterium GW2011_GWB2_45_17]HBC44775.1 hypothetical protein [Candidatus Collierbacteria bacterium]
MTVLTEKPLSFEIEDFLAALAARNDDFFFMINPETWKPIDKVWLNIPTIGLSTHDRSKDGPLGFKTKTKKPELPDNDTYEPEAQLVLDVPSQNLPQGIDGLIWVLQVRNFEMLETFRPIADALAEEFKVTIIMSPSQINDSDPMHREPQPVDPQLPKGAQFNPIVIRFVK